MLEGLHEDFDLSIAIEISNGWCSRRPVPIPILLTGVLQWYVMKNRTICAQDDEVS
jgi:hypothetical protein